MTPARYRLFDVDNHYYEAPDAYTRYLEPEYRDQLPGKVGGTGSKPPGQEGWVVRPGSLKEYLRKMKSGNAEEPYVLMAPLPGFHDRDERIKLGKEIWAIAADEVHIIGVIGLGPAAMGVRVAKTDLGNIPSRQYNSPDARTPGISRPVTFYWKSAENRRPQKLSIQP